MRGAFIAVVVSLAAACGSSNSRGSFDDTSSGGPGDGGSSGSFADAGGEGGPDPDAGTTTTTIIYANTDDTLYALDPKSNAVTKIGAFNGNGQKNVTDCAVDASGNVFVNTNDTIYSAALPSGGGGSVTLTKIATIAVGSGQQFFALAFAPAGVLDATETLVGGDGNGELWSIDSKTGAIKDLGSFGPDKTNVFALSGDIVFYDDGSGNPTGLATIRSCKSGGSNCTTTDDYLAGVDMAALTNAYKSGTPAKSLLKGIYGGSASSKGSGVGRGEIFGLGA
ncbi:MAG TPA: hypothetical protein VIF62_32985, partial [Labilithrix sp.]